MIERFEERLVHVDGYSRTRNNKREYVGAYVRGAGGRARPGDQVVGVTPGGDLVTGPLRVRPDRSVFAGSRRIVDIHAVRPPAPGPRRLPGTTHTPDPKALRRDVLSYASRLSDGTTREKVEVTYPYGRRKVSRRREPVPKTAQTPRARQYVKKWADFIAGEDAEGKPVQMTLPPPFRAYGLDEGEARQIQTRLRSIMARHGADNPLGFTGRGVITADGRWMSRAGHAGGMSSASQGARAQRLRRIGYGMAESPNGKAHDDQPPLTDEQRRYPGQGAGWNLPAPRSVRDLKVWEEVAGQRNTETGRSYHSWTQTDYDAVMRAYRERKGLPLKVRAGERYRDMPDNALVDQITHADPETARRMYKEIVERNDPDGIARSFGKREDVQHLDQAIRDAEALDEKVAADILQRARAARAITFGSKSDRRRAAVEIIHDQTRKKDPYLEEFGALKDPELLRTFSNGELRQLARAALKHGDSGLSERLERLGIRKQRPRFRKAPRSRAGKLVNQAVREYLRGEEPDTGALSFVLRTNTDDALRRLFNRNQLHVIAAIVEQHGGEHEAAIWRQIAAEPTVRAGAAGYTRQTTGRYLPAEKWPGVEQDRLWLGGGYPTMVRAGSDTPVVPMKPVRISDAPLSPEELKRFRRVDLAEVRQTFFGHGTMTKKR